MAVYDNCPNGLCITTYKESSYCYCAASALLTLHT